MDFEFLRRISHKLVYFSFNDSGNFSAFTTISSANLYRDAAFCVPCADVSNKNYLNANSTKALFEVQRPLLATKNTWFYV